MKKEELIKKHEKNSPITIIDGVTILGRDVNEENHTVYIVEKYGEKKVVLYNQIDQTKLPKKDFEEFDMVVVKKGVLGEEKIYLKNYDELGNYIDIDFELERDKFIHPEKYAKKDIKA